MRRIAVAASIALLLAINLGCPPEGPSLPPTTPGGGWILETFIIEEGVLSTAQEVTVNGAWQKDLPGAQGNANAFTVETNVLGLAGLPTARAPAAWKLTWVGGGGVGNLCDGQSSTVDALLDQTIDFVCTIIEIVGGGASGSASSSDSPFQFSPDPLDAANPPATVTVHGSGFQSQYGMPLLQYFDLSGNLVAQSNAQNVAPDGAWISANTPDLSQIPSGTYAGFVSNATASGGWQVLGATEVAVVAAPPSGGGGGGGGSCSPHQPGGCVLAP